jgi:hypothetical protein
MSAPRWLRGDTAPVKAFVATALAVEIGDLVALIGNTVVKPSGVAWDTNLATTQAAFVTGFVGIARQKKVADTARVFGNSEDNMIVVATGGDWEFELDAAATSEVGTFYGPAKDTGNALVDQALVSVTTVEAGAVGVCIARNTTWPNVQIRLLSKLARFARAG